MVRISFSNLSPEELEQYASDRISGQFEGTDGDDVLLGKPDAQG